MSWWSRKTQRLSVICIFIAIGAFTSSVAITAEADESEDSEELEVSDPFEKWNRGVFWVNEITDRYFIEYIAKGYALILPDPLQRGIHNVFENGRLPIKFGNSLLQLKFKSAGEEIVRFGLNTTVGIGGLFDAASQGGLPSHNEDFGQTLGHWGVSTAPFIMVPFIGPMNLRDGFGLGVDSLSLFYSFFLPLAVNASLTAGYYVDTRASFIDVIRDNRESAFDLYVLTRNAYMANRRYRVLDRDLVRNFGYQSGAEDDLYQFNEDDEEEEDLYFFEDEE